MSFPGIQFSNALHVHLIAYPSTNMQGRHAQRLAGVMDRLMLVPLAESKAGSFLLHVTVFFQAAHFRKLLICLPLIFARVHCSALL